jgi:hypothetical protein
VRSNKCVRNSRIAEITTTKRRVVVSEREIETTLAGLAPDEVLVRLLIFDDEEHYGKFAT